MLGDPEKFFLAELDTIERAIRFASRRGALRGDDAADFASFVKLKLIEDHYAVIRKYGQRSTFAAFISVVIQRLLLDYRIAQWGKWHASAQARRFGESGIAVEAMLVRDGRSIDEAVPALQRRWPELTRDRIAAIADSLPPRTARPRVVDIDAATETIGATAADVDNAAFASDLVNLSRRIAAVVRSTMSDLDEHDRLIFRLRFEAGMSVAEISRTLRVEQKPLYRRLQRGLAALRRRLEEEGITAAEAEEVLESRSTDLDFGFGYGTAMPAAGEEEC